MSKSGKFHALQRELKNLEEETGVKHPDTWAIMDRNVFCEEVMYLLYENAQEKRMANENDE